MVSALEILGASAQALSVRILTLGVQTRCGAAR